MRTRSAWLVSIVLCLLAGTAGAQAFGVPDSKRAGRWEGYAGLQYLLSEDVDFEGGSTIEVDDDLGFEFGFGYNFNEHFLLSGELAWSNPDYDGQLVSADTPGTVVGLSGEFDALTVSAAGTWHFFEGPVTPYVSARLGYTWIDTNIADGPPVTGCWWDPWWGYICDTFVDTKDEEALSYGLGVGLRWDFGPDWFTRVSYEERWLDLDEASGTPGIGGVHIDVGARF
jgi:opacity protein-like surface antigen